MDGSANRPYPGVDYRALGMLLEKLDPLYPDHKDPRSTINATAT